MSNFVITLSVDQPSIRLDLALLEALKLRQIEISRNSLKSAFHEKKLFYRGIPAKPSQILFLGTHEVTWKNWNPDHFAPPQAHASERGCFLPVVYEDENLLVLNKETKIPSIPHLTSETETAVGAALARCPDLVHVGRKGLEPGIIHRLDTDTSGLLVFAKTQEEFERLSLEWKKREVEKYYRAWVKISSPLPAPPVRLDFPLAHDAHSSKKMIGLNKPTRNAIRGKPLPAVTTILALHKTVEVEESQATSHETYTDLEIQIETGVMHQIRCHLSTMGWPIVGDQTYRGDHSERLWLHAWRLKLPLKNGVWLTLEAALPEGWNSIVKPLQRAL